MIEPGPEYTRAIEQAKTGLKNGDYSSARRWAHHAAALEPGKEDPWLILAAISSPKASIEYLNTALRINPTSQRAQKGLTWASQRLNAHEQSNHIAPTDANSQPPAPNTPSDRKNTILIWLLCLLVLFSAVFPIISSPEIRSYFGDLQPAALAQAAQSEPALTQPALFSELINPEPAVLAPTNLPTITPSLFQIVPDPEPIIAITEALLPMLSPEATPTISILPTIADEKFEPIEVLPYNEPHPPTEEPLLATEEPLPPTEEPLPPPEEAAPTIGPDGGFSSPDVKPGERWVDVDLSQQRVYAFEGDQIVNSFVVSTGKRYTPTVKGQYRIYIKLRSANMSGPGYFLEGVPFVMYFYKGYGLHGTYWHKNFGTPMSHGCVNFRVKDARWIFEWASVGTLVNVHK